MANDFFDDLRNAFSCGVEFEAIGSFFKWSDLAVHVGEVTLFDIFKNCLVINLLTAVLELRDSTESALSGRSREINLQCCVREDHGPDVSAIENGRTITNDRPLPLRKEIPDDLMF